ncbi:MAG: multidrug transporter ATP-binding protein [Solirubrobacterales bacterium]|jgi:ABC-2 type transport system ATP-binding protein|nr:multidrug transporter ATP-binding protein [Solirubrobacterales bacterium]
MCSDAAISVRDLNVRRGEKLVLPGISLEIERGAVTGLLGPSGTGKTTLIRAIVGVQIVESGAVTILGEPAGSAGLRARVAYVTQAPSVYRDLTVRENLRYFARILDVPGERIAEVIETVSLGEDADREVDNLSGGQGARVSLATALLGRPEVLVLDEPTVGLDPVLRADLWRTFAGLAAEGATLLISSHVMDEAVHCDRLLLMREGDILAASSPDELLRRTGTRDMGEAFLKLIEEGRSSEAPGA